METEPCRRCLDTGKCPSCGGSGALVMPQVDGKITTYPRLPCAACYGSGKCPACQPVSEPSLPA